MLPSDVYFEPISLGRGASTNTDPAVSIFESIAGPYTVRGFILEPKARKNV